MNPPPDFVLFLGRFHPVLVHFPIALILVVAFAEILARFDRWKALNSGVGWILMIAAPGSILTAVLGWLLSRAGGYEDKLLNWHMWTGFATAVLCTAAALLYTLNLKKLYRVSLFITTAALVLASHYGGSLTHGSDYLVRYAPQPVRLALGLKPAARSSETAAVPGGSGANDVYTTVIHPILDKNCIACHGPEKSKGGLRLDSLVAAIKGGDSGPALVAGKAADSLMIKRIRLPLDHDEHMPPSGKPQPTPDDIAILDWWINAGAASGTALAALPKPQNISLILESRVARGVASPSPAKATEAALPASVPPLVQILPLANQLASELGIAIAPLSESESWLQCNASVAGPDFGDPQLAKLAPLAANLRWLDLGGTKVTDEGLVHLSPMTNLTRLHLQRTQITDAAIDRLKPVRQLSYLNLYGTRISDSALEALTGFPQLRQIYLWQTAVSPEAAKAFAESRVNAEEIKRWEQEIDALKSRIRAARILVNTGISLSTNVTSAGASAVNTLCPVSGKPVATGKTTSYDGRLVAFCCDDCKAKFQQDPKPFLAKLNLQTSNTAKPVNSLCPVSGKAVDPTKTYAYEGKLVAFCCADCCARFQKDPKPFLSKLNSASGL